jgi:lipoate-protein ligase A
MLLDAQIGQLRGVLHNTKDSMVGRSVASVRSPVRNISDLVGSPITHEDFVTALSEAFASTYSVDGKVVKLGEDIMDERHPFENAFIGQSIKELRVILVPKGLDYALMLRFV